MNTRALGLFQLSNAISTVLCMEEFVCVWGGDPGIETDRRGNYRCNTAVKKNIKKKINIPTPPIHTIYFHPIPEAEKKSIQKEGISISVSAC